jgi:hypothetical protein
MDVVALFGICELLRYIAQSECVLLLLYTQSSSRAHLNHQTNSTVTMRMVRAVAIRELTQLDIRDSWREARNPVNQDWTKISVKSALKIRIRRQSGNKFRARRYIHLLRSDREPQDTTCLRLLPAVLIGLCGRSPWLRSDKPSMLIG